MAAVEESTRIEADHECLGPEGDVPAIDERLQVHGLGTVSQRLPRSSRLPDNASTGFSGGNQTRFKPLDPGMISSARDEGECRMIGGGVRLEEELSD